MEATLRQKGYIDFLKQKKKSARTISNYTEFVQQYEAYLRKHKNGKKIDATMEDDLVDFARWADQSKTKTNQYLWGIKEYFDYLSMGELELAVNAMLGERYMSQFKLKDFMGVKPSHLRKLAKGAVTTAKDMLYAGLTRQKRLEISRNTGIPIKDVLELVQLSDQARIGGHKKVRARLYHEAGFDTIDKMAACDPAELRQSVADFIQKTGFKGIPPTPGEARNTVTMARYLKRIVEY